MNYLKSIAAVLSAPLVYGFVCVPLVGVVMSMYPEITNPEGGSHDTLLILKVEFVQLAVLLLAGFIVAVISPARQMLHTGAAVVLMLGIGVSVQLQYWDAMPAWHHFVFFGLIVLGMLAGAGCRVLMVRHPHDSAGQDVTR